MNEELTRVFEKYELEAMIEFYKNNDCSRRVARELATALLEERAKPKVWDGAPDEADYVTVGAYKNSNPLAPIKVKCYTREPPKSSARKIAEECVHEHINKETMDRSLADIIESAILKDREEREADR